MTDELNFRIPLENQKPAGNETLINNQGQNNAKGGSSPKAQAQKPASKGLLSCACLHIEYGPFWILTTLIFVIACAGNMSSMLEAWLANAVYASRFDFIPLAASTIYTFGIIVPVIFGVLLKYLGSKEVSILNTVIIYCYSLCPLIVSLVVAIIPSDFVDWIVLIFGIGASTLFVFKNYEPKYQGGSRYCLLGFFGIAQFCLLLVFKLSFYDPVFTTTTPTTA